MARAHPREPHWYLFGIGVGPARPGTGVGSALLRSRLDRCDHDGQLVLPMAVFNAPRADCAEGARSER